MVKNEICLWAASKQNPLFFKICVPKKRTHASNAPVSKIGPDRYMLCICVYQNVWIFDKMCQKFSRWFCIYVSPQNKTTRKSCSQVTDATTFPKPAGQPPKIFQIIHVNNWLWQNCYLQEILNELMVMPENGVTLARSIFADICHSYFNLALWYFKYGEKAYVKCE